MKMNNYYISILALLFLLGACSEADLGIKEETGKEELAINAGISTSVEVESRVTRANGASFTKPFDLFVNQTAPTGFIKHTKFEAKYETNRFNVYSGTDRWYWDNKGGVTAKVNLLGVYPKNNMSVDNVFNTNGFDWSVKANQTADSDSVASDLLISKQVANYDLVTQKSSKANIEFHHVFSKLTFILKKGTGFKTDGSDFNPSLTTVALQPTANVKIATDNGAVTITPKGTAAAITPHLVSVDATTKEQILAAIVVPGQTITKGSTFATVAIEINGSTNSYPINLPNESGDENIVFASGSNYAFEVTVNKTGAQVSATIVPWDSAPATVKKEINITVGGNEALSNADIKVGASLYIKVSKGATPTEVSGLRSMTAYGKTANEWAALNPVLYWDDIPTSTNTYANAILYNKSGNISTINNNPDDIYRGNSQALSSAVTYLRFENMVHPFSKLNIKIRTEQEVGDKVDLTKLTNIKFDKAIAQFKGIDMDMTSTNTGFQAITYRSNTGAELSDVTPAITGTLHTETDVTSPVRTYEFYDSKTIYIKPGVTLSSGQELLRVFYVDGDIKNEYPWKLASTITFAENTEYNIVITLKKTEIAKVGVTIKAWEKIKDPIGGEAGIDK